MTERPTAPPPHHAYATITGVFAAGLALAGGLAYALGRDPREQTWRDLVTLSAAISTRPNGGALHEGIAGLGTVDRPG